MKKLFKKIYKKILYKIYFKCYQLWYKIEYKDVCIKQKFNYNLACRQGLILDDLYKLIPIYEKKDKIFKNMKQTDDSKKLKKFAKLITKIEFKLQTIWKFEKNQDFHRFWEVPKCKCPIIDNIDNQGSKYHYHNNDCPIHGDK